MTSPEPQRPAAGAVGLDEVERAVQDIRAGRAVVVVDDAARENEGDIIFAASKATPELLAFTIRYSSGVICVPMRGADLDRLHIPLMTTQNSERMRTGSLLEVANVLKALLVLNQSKSLSFREKKMLERARYLLVSELAMAKNCEEPHIEELLTKALSKSNLRFPEASEFQA